MLTSYSNDAAVVVEKHSKVLKTKPRASAAVRNKIPIYGLSFEDISRSAEPVLDSLGAP